MICGSFNDCIINTKWLAIQFYDLLEIIMRSTILYIIGCSFHDVSMNKDLKQVIEGTSERKPGITTAGVLKPAPDSKTKIFLHISFKFPGEVNSNP